MDCEKCGNEFLILCTLMDVYEMDTLVSPFGGDEDRPQPRTLGDEPAMSLSGLCTGAPTQVGNRLGPLPRLPGLGIPATPGHGQFPSRPGSDVTPASSMVARQTKGTIFLG